MRLALLVERGAGASRGMSAPAGSHVEEDEENKQQTRADKRVRQVEDEPDTRAKRSCLPGLPCLATPQAVWLSTASRWQRV
eukprot:747597-Hanusia_phi.AAC.6